MSWQVIVNSRSVNDHLPHSIQGFFVMQGASAAADGYSNVVNAHRAFLSEYGLSADEVPLLTFNPSSWDAPFIVRHG